MRNRSLHSGSRRVHAAWITTVIWLGIAASLLTGCGGSGTSGLASQARLAKSTPSLGVCVWRWNHASLGEGFEGTRLDAFKGTSALMVKLPDGACVLVFPRAVVQRTPMINFLDGDYQMRWSPLGYVSSSEIVALQDDADRQTNVLVRKSNGHILARPHTRIFAVAAVAFRNESGCVRFIDPHYALTARFEVLRTSVPCATVRVLGWAWPAREESAEHVGRSASILHIIGWRCVGSKLIRGLTPTTYENVMCAHGRNFVELRDLARQAILQSPPSGG